MRATTKEEEMGYELRKYSHKSLKEGQYLIKLKDSERFLGKPDSMIDDCLLGDYCQGFSIFGRVPELDGEYVDLIFIPKELDTDDTEYCSEIICPYCGYEHIAEDGDMYTKEDEFKDYECHNCEKEFEYTTKTSYSWSSYKK